MERRKKILIINTTDIKGGAARVASDVGNQIKSKEYDVKYFVGCKRTESPTVYELGKNTLIEKIGSKFGINLVSLSRLARSFILSNDIDFGAEDEILNHSWYKEANLVHCHNLHGNFFRLDTLSKISSKKPVVWTLHDGWAITAQCPICFDCKHYNNGNHFTPGILRYNPMLWDNSEYLWQKKKNVYKKSSKLNIVVPSLWMAERVKTSILGDKPLEVINNGIDTSIFKPAANKLKLRLRYKVPIDKKIVLYVAQLGIFNSKKGFDYFKLVSEHFSGNPDVFFLCVGGNPDILNSKNKNVLYIPFIMDKKTLSEYYSLSDMFLFPSLAENFPLVNLEALASGLPVVSFDVGGIREQISHKINGYIARYMDGIDLIEGCEYILNLNKEEMQKINEGNRKKTVENFSIEKMTNKYMDLYDRLLNKNL